MRLKINLIFFRFESIVIILNRNKYDKFSIKKIYFKNIKIKRL